MKKLLFMIFTLFFITSCNSNLTISKTDTFKVNISGEVNYPGSYVVNSNQTLSDLITLAGGLTDSAGDINLNEVIQPGKDYIIYSNIYNPDLININTADLDSLTLLAGIGSSTAIKIINYRNEFGLFTSIEDIKKVNGIKEVTYNKIKDYICV